MKFDVKNAGNGPDPGLNLPAGGSRGASGALLNKEACSSARSRHHTFCTASVIRGDEQMTR